MFDENVRFNVLMGPPATPLLVELLDLEVVAPACMLALISSVFRNFLLSYIVSGLSKANLRLLQLPFHLQVPKGDRIPNA